MESNIRIKSAVKRALEGESIRIVYLGGAVTAGNIPGKEPISENYAKLSFDHFCSKTKNKNHVYNNYGFAGASSIFGLALTERFLREDLPDIVFVEYALNDASDNESRNAFEGLIRKLLELESRPAVIPFFTANKDFSTAEPYMKEICRNYGLQVISASDRLREKIDAHEMKWSDYSADTGHPGTEGHRFLAECIKEYFNSVWKDKVVHEQKNFPDPLYSKEYENYSNIFFDSIRDLYMSGFAFEKKSILFPGGVSSTFEDQSVLSFTARFRILYIVFEQGNSLSSGELQIYIDNNYTENISGYSLYGRNNPVVKLVCKNDHEAFHDVKIIMKNNTGRRYIHIFGMGMC